MRNLILLIALVVSMFSNAQSLTLSRTIEVTPFTYSNVDYKHVKGSLATGEDCIDNVGWGATNILSLDGNEIIDLNANGRYMIADEPFRDHFISFENSDDIFLADGGAYNGPDLLECVSVFNNPRLDADHDCAGGAQVRGGHVRIPGLARFDVINTSQLVNIPQVHIENTKAFVLSAGPGIPVNFDDPRAQLEAAYTENRPFLYFKRGLVGTHISGVVVSYQGSTTIDMDFNDGDDVFGIFCSTVVPELERLTRLFVSELDAAEAAASGTSTTTTTVDSQEGIVSPALTANDFTVRNVSGTLYSGYALAGLHTYSVSWNRFTSQIETSWIYTTTGPNGEPNYGYSGRRFTPVVLENVLLIREISDSQELVDMVNAEIAFAISQINAGLGN